ncbi:hypothetical protein NEHOM01_0649 [Nematocida homosporus]|uniref:uncharacterized protein n=1 Tax=Nematocida homosporus TaxID=1912981 RepID=UPI00221F58D4|nr:uncharacterized protein NEHOM01_0649 [Nematocida homosporus]KAI5185144.1 hypothetical protein NEHOM01_0649 [Nematocida homosporus]
MITDSSVKIRCCHMLKRWAMSFCVLIVMLMSVRGDNEVGRLDQLEPPTPEVMLVTLYSVGFLMANENIRVAITPYTPPPSQNPLKHSSLLEAPSYEVEYANAPLNFVLPNYISREAAVAALNKLRTIAVIRTDVMHLTCGMSNLTCRQESMQIMSRVINMADCKSLVLFVATDLKMDAIAAPVNLNICRQEADHTFRHITYEMECRLVLSSLGNNKIPDLKYCGIIMLRPISTVCLMGLEILQTPLLDKLPLVDGYALIFMSLPNVINLDFKFLQTAPPKCKSINIMPYPDAIVKLTGLDDVIRKHPMLTLNTNWSTFQYLGRNSTQPIRVHTIAGLDVCSFSISDMLMAPSKEPIDPCVFATTAVCQISLEMTCKPLDYYRQLYTPEALSKYGISVNHVEIRYVENRTDLYNTLDILVRCNALSAIPNEVQRGDIRCLGEATNNPEWRLKETVKIRLNTYMLDEYLRDYKLHCCRLFCQNIRYTAIEIDGDRYSYAPQARSCARLLTLFQDIDALELRITNVRDPTQPTSDFISGILKEEIAKRFKCRLNVKKLILDNVDDSIIYRMLGRYVFVGPTEVHILNQNFTNLAIAQVFTMQECQNISVLVINDFIGLNEVRQYRMKDLIIGFSLFKYVEETVRKGKTIQDLQLWKLALHLDGVAVDWYSDILRELYSYNLQLLAVPFDDYLLKMTPQPSPALTMPKDKFTLYNVDLIGLATDLACYKVQLLDQQAPVQKIAVKDLIVRFRSNQVLKEKDLVTTVRWVSSRFKEVVILRFLNAEAAIDLMETTRRHHYLVRDLKGLKSIRLEGTNPYSPPVEVLVNAPRVGLLTNANNPEPAVIAMSQSVLSQLATHHEQLDQLIPAPLPNDSTTSLQKIAKHIKENRHELLCSVCLDTLYIPTRPEANTEVSAQPGTDHNSEEHSTTFCYRKCGHPHCGKCLIRTPPNDRCPDCRNESRFDGIDWLISVPPASFIFAQDNTNVANADSNWHDSITWVDGQVYLYVSYRRQSDLATMLRDNIATQGPGSIYVI